MCGIVGFVGSEGAKEKIIDGLKRLEYRGYDSAGVAVFDGKEIQTVKAKGRLKNLKDELLKTPVTGNLGIGHTRWATHGAPCAKNSHPHTSQDGKIAVVHNGIIENYEQLRAMLENKGYTFKSETDTEVIPHLVELYYDGDIFCAVKKAVSHLSGSYALGIICENGPDKLVAVRKESPLIIGVGDGENFIASDIPAILSETENVYFLNDGEIAVITKDTVDIFMPDFKYWFSDTAKEYSNCPDYPEFAKTAIDKEVITAREADTCFISG